MDIQEANINELKSYIGALMLRYTAISGHFGLVRAELVEMSRLAQLTLARLIEIEGRDIEQFITERTLHNYYPQLDNVENIETEELRMRFMELMHMSGGHAHSVATSFPENVSTGLVMNEDTDYSEAYAKYRKELAEIHAMSLKAQVALSHLLQANNRERFRSGL